MNFLAPYFTSISDTELRVSGEQGSRFAKRVADDFNPIHHPHSKRFCVPGDLLFAIAVVRYGIHQHMEFRFLDLLAADMPVIFPAVAESQMVINNAKGKATVGITLDGNKLTSERQIESLIKNYVAFSGHNFPDILAPLMREHGVMVNPQRPLVIYESMRLDFDSLNFNQLNVELADTRLEVKGKRGDTELSFDLLNSVGQRIGRGMKKLIMSGLRDYQQEAVEAMQDEYTASKQMYAD